MREAKVIQLPVDNDAWWEHEFPKLEMEACLDKAFYTPKTRSLKELLEFEAKIFSDLALVWSKLRPGKRERFVEKCVPYWRDMRAMHEKIRALVREMLREQGVEI
jgi:hypothetical protein